MDFKTIVNRFNTTPFLFIGSGFSRRYYNLPDWQGLLRIFVERMDDDAFALQKYLNRAESGPGEYGDRLAAAAGLIMRDFDARWYDDPAFRTDSERDSPFVRAGHSPFKVAVAQYIEANSVTVPEVQDELSLFKEISKKSVAGIITTNYDTLLEKETEYKTFVGQEELIFSSLQGWAEVYKIHGSVTDPSSIVITDSDYKNFQERCPYLAAKLMTIFVEYPIIFIGYSITDSNIRMILHELGRCLSSKNLKKLQDRFIYVQYKKGQQDIEISQHSISIGENILHMTGVETDNFMSLYHALSVKKATFPAKIIRIFKQEFYDYALTNKPTSKIRIADIDDERVQDEDLIIGIERRSEFALKGLAGIETKEWYRYILFHHLEFTADELLEYAYPRLMSGSNILSLNMVLAEATGEYPECRKSRVKTFDEAVNATIQKGRKNKNIRNRSVNGILEDRGEDKINAMVDIAYLSEEEIDIDQLEMFLKDCFKEDGYIDNITVSSRSNFYRLIRIYDYLKYGRHTESLD